MVPIHHGVFYVLQWDFYSGYISSSWLGERLSNRAKQRGLKVLVVMYGTVPSSDRILLHNRHSERQGV